jgi:hypothetical protein
MEVPMETCIDKNLNDPQNRRRFMKTLATCAAFMPPAIYELIKIKPAHAVATDDSTVKERDHTFYDEILKTAKQDYVRYT